MRGDYLHSDTINGTIFRKVCAELKYVLNDANSAIKSKKMWAFLCPEILFFQFEIRHNGKLLFQKIEIGKTQLA